MVVEPTKNALSTDFRNDVLELSGYELFLLEFLTVSRVP